MKRYRLRPFATRRILAGERLVTIDDFEQPEQAENLEEGMVIYLSDAERRLNAKALVGRQNKGLAWVFTNDEEDFWDETFIAERLEQAIESRKDFLAEEQTVTTAFRLFNGEGDGIGGVTIDWYSEFVQFNWYSRGIYEYREWFVTALKELLPDIKGVYETKRYKLYDNESAIEHTSGDLASQPLVVKENSIEYAVYLGEEWMTGIFLDQREVRSFVQTQANDLKVLNLFSYTGAFSVAAAVGGAAKTVSVDVANRSLERTKEQFALNGIDGEPPQHEIRVMDVFAYVNYAKRHELSFDLVVCDPPSFARTKKRLFKAEKDYAELAKDLFDITAPGGLCILSTNHSGYKKEAFIEEISALGRSHSGHFQMIQSFGLPNDFPTSADSESQYLKVLVFYRNN